MASVVATGIGRPSGLMRTSSCSIDPKRRMASAYGPSTRRVVSDATVICENHESIQSGPAAESPWPFERHERFAVTLSSAGSTPVSAANVRTRCRKPISLVGDHFSRPSAMYGPRLECCESGREQAGSGVDREAAVLDPAKSAEEEGDNAER